ncbi:MAG: 2-hydroxycarboxylate transporter family protein [Sedimentibacter sp.]
MVGIDIKTKKKKIIEKKSEKATSVIGMNVYLWIASCAIIIISSKLGILPDDMTGAFAICLGVGLISFVVGDKIPVVNTYLGGGVIVTLFLGSSITYFKLLPQTTIDTIFNFIGPMGFLNLFIIVLIVGSIVTIDRKLLLNAVAKFIPTIIAAIIGSIVLAIPIGLLFGVTPSRLIAYYVLPIMCGGSGAGALPLAEMFSSMTGVDYNEYLSVSMAMLSVGNLFAILFAAFFSKVVAGNSKLSGEGELIKNKKNSTEKEKIYGKPTLADLANSLIIIFAIYMLAVMFNKIILPTVFGVSIHTFAYVVLITVALKVGNVIPDNITSALIYTQKYFIAAFVVVIMFACGIAYTDLGVFITALTSISNILICFAVVMGAMLGGGLFGILMGFYPFEAGVASGLCMANAGGTGDVAVLSACNRMNMMAYAQISSRIGNAIILIFASVIFNVMF